MKMRSSTIENHKLNQQSGGKMKKKPLFPHRKAEREALCQHSKCALEKMLDKMGPKQEQEPLKYDHFLQELHRKK